MNLSTPLILRGGRVWHPGINHPSGEGVFRVTGHTKPALCAVPQIPYIVSGHTVTRNEGVLQ